MVARQQHTLSGLTDLQMDECGRNPTQTVRHSLPADAAGAPAEAVCGTRAALAAK